MKFLAARGGYSRPRSVIHLRMYANEIRGRRSAAQRRRAKMGAAPGQTQGQAVAAGGRAAERVHRHVHAVRPGPVPSQCFENLFKIFLAT